MATRLHDLTPSSSRATGVGVGNDGGLQSPAHKDSPKTGLRKALEMPMYDNGDLSLSKIQEVAAEGRLRTVDEEEGSRAASTGSRQRRTGGQSDILAKLKEANNRYG